MPSRQHTYQVTVTWNSQQGTRTYAGYSRDHTIDAGSKPQIAGSSDKAFRGDPTRWNPEDLLLASLSACHKLWYLHLCAEAGIVVLSYQDEAQSLMQENASGAGRFTQATLRPTTVIAQGGDIEKAATLHQQAHEYCFVANSVNFPITYEPVITFQ